MDRHRVKPPLPPLRVLVAEDNPVNQMFARALLQREGHHMTLAVNGQEAVDLATHAGFDVVLMDVQMPVLDGLNATKQIRKWECDSGSHLPIIAVTAHAMAGDREICLDAGMDAYLTKPIRGDVLFAAIAHLLHHVPADLGAPLDGGVADDVFDPVSLLELTQGDRLLAQELATLFLEEAPAQITAMRNAIGATDGRRLKAVAHAIRGAAATISATRIVADARLLERDAESGDWPEALRIVGGLEGELLSLRDRVTLWSEER